MITPVYTANSSWGPVTVIKNIVRGLGKRGFDFVVHAGNSESPNRPANLPAREYVDGVLVKRYKAVFSVGNYQFTPLMALDLLRDDYDIVHAHVARSFQLDLAASVSMLRSKPLIVSAHGTLANYLHMREMSSELRTLHKVHNTLLKRSLDRAEIVTALSELEAKQYREIFKVSPKRIVVIPNGVDLSLYEKLPPRGVFKSKFGIDYDKRIILYVGRINKVKGIDFLIKSFSYLVNDLALDRAVLAIAGPDDGYLHEAKLLSETMGISDRVVFTGFLTEGDKLCAFVDSNVVVHLENFNVILIAPFEAAASGKPIVVSEGDFLGEIARREGFGFSVRYGDTIGTATLLRRLLDENDLAGAMGNKGRQFVFGNLGWPTVLEGYDKAYSSAIKMGMRN